MGLIIYLASIFATTILSGTCTFPLFLNTKDDFHSNPIKSARKSRIYISRIYILETARFCFSLTWMDGPRGAGRLGVAAEGGAKPIGLYLIFFIPNF